MPDLYHWLTDHVSSKQTRKIVIYHSDPKMVRKEIDRTNIPTKFVTEALFDWDQFSEVIPSMVDDCRLGVTIIGEFTKAEWDWMIDLSNVFVVDYMVNVEKIDVISALKRIEDDEPNITTPEMQEPTWEAELKLMPRKINVRAWEEYLMRSLKRDERRLFEHVKYERHINGMLKDLHIACASRQLYIPYLTNLEGNCMFESLNAHGLGENPGDLRQALAYFMFQFQNKKDMMPNETMTLRESFDTFEKLALPDYVFCPQKGHHYRYGYNVMCQDLADNGSWTKLPANLILATISYLFHLRIVIALSTNSKDGDTIIDIWQSAPKEEQDKVRTIYLGQLSESHYVPLFKVPEDEAHPEPIMYDRAYNTYREWKGHHVNAMYQKRMRIYERINQEEVWRTSYGDSYGYDSSNRFSALADSDGEKDDGKKESTLDEEEFAPLVENLD